MNYSTRRAHLFMLCSVTSVAVSSFFIKICLIAHMPILTIMLWRFFIPAILFVLFYFCRRTIPLVRKKSIVIILTRAFFLVSAQILMTIGMVGLPLSEVVLLFSTSSIFIVLYDILIGKEKLGKKLPFLLCCGFIGVIITLYSSDDKINIYIIFALCSGFFMAISQLLFYSSVRDNNPIFVIFYLYIFSAIFVLIGLVIKNYPFSTFYLLNKTLLINASLMAVSGIPHQICRAYAYKLVANTSQLATFSYLTIVIALIFDIAYFHIIPSLQEWIGGFIIILVSLLFARLQHHH